MCCPYIPNAKQASEEASNAPETSNDGPYKPIPQPPTHWFTKNIPEIDPAVPAASIWMLADIYGEIFQLDLVSHKTIVLSTQELINEAMNEERFEKNVSGGL